MVSTAGIHSRIRHADIYFFTTFMSFVKEGGQGGQKSRFKRDELCERYLTHPNEQKLVWNLIYAFPSEKFLITIQILIQKTM